MPTYVYKCENEHTFEVFQAMAEDALDSCEVCGTPAQRVLFAPAVHFKGSGFYTTDYAKKGAKAASNGDDGEGSKSESKESKSESKSEDSNGSKSDSGSSSSTKSDSKAASGKGKD